MSLSEYRISIEPAAAAADALTTRASVLPLFNLVALVSISATCVTSLSWLQVENPNRRIDYIFSSPKKVFKVCRQRLTLLLSC